MTISVDEANTQPSPARSPLAAGRARLRILFLVSRDIRHPANTGGDIGLWERAQYLAEVGHEVTLIASTFQGAAREEMIDGIKVVRIGGLLSMWWRTFVFYIRHCRGKYDVVVVEGFGGSRIPRFTPLYVTEPIVTEWHQIHSALFAVQYPRVLSPLLNLLERITARVHRNTIVMARTADWADTFPSIGFKRENIRIVPACISQEWLEADHPTGVAGPNFIWLGKFRRYKCPDHAIRAMKHVIASVPEAKLTLAGFHDDRVYEAELQELAHKLGIDNNITFRFGISSEEKRASIDACRALVLPSTVEGFGIVVLEANGRRVPVIASSGVPEGAVRDGGNGLRYKFGRIDDLARCLIRVATDNRLFAQLSAESYAFAQQFEWRAVCSRYEQVLIDAFHSVDRRQRVEPHS